MKVKDLIAKLKQYPDDMEVWVSDRGYCEGGEPLQKVEKVLAYDAGLDGDSIDGEYIYIEDLTEDPEHYLSQDYHLHKDGDVLSKEIVYLNDI